MKARKLLSGFTVLALSVLVLGACGTDNGNDTAATDASTEVVESTEEAAAAGPVLQDGTFTLEEMNYSNDYRVVFSITVEDGKIVESSYDNLNEAGESKMDNADYNERMQEIAGNSPEEFIPAFNEALVAAQNASDLEVVSGATGSFNSFQNYAQQLIQAAQAGNTETIMINNGGELQDGTFTLEEKNYSNDYRVVFSITVEGGQIVESNYDNLNEAGESKMDNADYNERMQEIAGNSPEEFIPAFNEALVAIMAEEDGTPNGMDVVSGATHSFHSFVLYAQQLINAAQNGNTETIVIDNFVAQN